MILGCSHNNFGKLLYKIKPWFFDGKNDVLLLQFGYTSITILLITHLFIAVNH